MPARSAAFELTPLRCEGGCVAALFGFEVDEAPVFGFVAVLEFGLSCALLVAAAKKSAMAARAANMW
ncbi:MAG: hypothetical protein ACKVQU_17735 [Burkholderiales bacterium]